LTRIETRKGGGQKAKAAHAVQLTQRASEWAKEMSDFLAVSRPLSWPMVIPPKPWTSPYGGGFHFREGLDHPLIPRPLKPLPLVRRACKEQRRMLEEADLSVVYGGLNAVQGTAWRINQRVYGVLTKLLEEGKAAPGITPLDPAPVPERLPSEEAKDKKKLRARNNEARKVKKANAQMFSKRLAQHRTFAVAKKFLPYRELYFAHNLDFRGRVYTCSDDLSPQGNDLQRGLLEFAHGDPLDADGARWLAIHLANTWGFDKASFDGRVRWAYEHEEMILRIAEDPLENREWFKADKKTAWQFLAACFAWKDYRDGGEGTICRTRVMLDGSCSGIQHYSALLRDEVVGRAVNLVAAERPGDLYADIATAVIASTAISRTKPFALEWHDWKPCRKVVKQSVMTLPYGSTFLSNLDFVRDAARERFKLEGIPSWLTGDNEREAFIALARFTWNAMQHGVRRPIEGMAYVKQCIRASKAAAPGRQPHWVSPCGFPVVPPHHQKSGQLQVKTAINGQALSLNYRNATAKPNWGAIETGAAPNFVHSLDASHLLMSLKRAHDEGITQLAAVHDAFGTTPTKTARFAQILREEFAKLYQDDPFECLRGPLRDLGARLPDPPDRGTLDPAGIARATYLFA
jgi:DNA-directed RNA polymerase